MHRRKTRGVTLIEIILVIVIIGISASVIGPMLLNATKSANIAYTLNQLDTQGRFAIARIREDIRNTETLNNSSTNSIINFETVSGDSISYTITPSQYISRTDNGITGDLASNVSNLSFSYFDRNGAEITSISESNVNTIAYVRPAFTLSLDGHSVQFRSTIFLRNTDIEDPA